MSVLSLLKSSIMDVMTSLLQSSKSRSQTVTTVAPSSGPSSFPPQAAAVPAVQTNAVRRAPIFFQFFIRFSSFLCLLFAFLRIS